MKKEYGEYQLVLLNGKVITVTYPEDLAEEVTEEMHDCFEMGKVWWVDNWEGTEAMYYGENLDYIDFKKVIGIRY